MSTLAVAVETGVYPVDVIATHNNPHLDEIEAIRELRRFGLRHFPGIDKARVVFWSKGDPELEIPAMEHLLQNKTLLVGIGDKTAFFNEHATVDSERKKDKSAALLVAEYLGVDDHPALESILDFVVRGDLYGNGNMFDIASVCLELYNSMPPEKVMLWATLGLEAIYQKQFNFVTSATEELRKASVSNVSNDNRSWRVVTIESDNQVVAKLARAKRGLNAAVVIQKKSSGRVQIYANRRFQINTDKIAWIIRKEEQKAKASSGKGRILTLNKEKLERDEEVLGAEEWYYFRSGKMLLNGSNSHPDASPTNLTLDEIKRIVCNCMW